MSTCVVNNTAFVVQGDIDDYDDWTLDGVADLANVTAIEGQVRVGKAGSFNEVTDTLTASVIDAVNRVVRVEYGGVLGWLADATLGTWMLQIQVTFSDGSEWTWPRRSDQADSPRIVVGRGG